jgi:hypothetical protein
MRIWLERSLNGCKASDEEAAAVLKKIPLGTTFEADVITRKSRSGSWHRRYWALCSMIAENCERVEVEPGMVLPITDSESAHVACKYLTGLYDSYAIKGGVVRILKSTAFDRMSAEEWERYWVKLLRAVHDKILPGVEIDAVENELARLAS